MTDFSTVYDRFLGKITDDMYLEISQEETLRDLQFLLLDSLPGFEFPRFDIYDYVQEEFIIREGNYWGDIKTGNDIEWNTILPVKIVENANEIPDDDSTTYLADESHFNCDLTNEEINILAILMVRGWLVRQINSCEVVRMKYTGIDFKMTSQANHLSKLISLKEELEQESLHYQRLYKRRRFNKEGRIISNWDIFGASALDD